MLYRVGFRSANLLKVSLVTTAAMLLAICVLALVETTNTAQANSLPDNGKIAFNHDDALYTVEPDGSNLSRLTNETYMVERPVWSPDGTKITFSSEGSGFSRISVMNADGSGLRHLRPNPIRNPATPTWLPDGTKLAFTAHLPGRFWDIFVMDPDGSNLNNVTGVGTDSTRSEFAPAFSPDGTQMCVLLADGVPNEGIYVMDADGSDPTLLVKEDLPRVIQIGCTWSPDGKKIAFSLTPSHEVHVINADGSALTNLTSNSASDALPDWSPDGKKIAFESDRDGDYDIYTMDADGSDVAQVTNLPGDDSAPDWQPLPGPTSSKSRSLAVRQPDTGGPSHFLVASALLFSGGVMLYAGLKRRM
jgi:TolB protein